MERKEHSVEEATKRAKSVFPKAFTGRENFGTTQALRKHLHAYVQFKLRIMKEEERSELMKRCNGADPCIAIGMS